MGNATAGGRANQKERTRQALLRATRELLDEGITPTIALAAARASLSEATAYRYYSEVRSLLHDSVDEQWPELERVTQKMRSMASVSDRAEAAARAMAAFTLSHEKNIRTLIALSYGPGQPSNTASEARPAFRNFLIDAVLEPTSVTITPQESRLLRQALSVVIAAEAVLSMKDALQSSNREIIETLGWSARCLAAALEQASKSSPES